MRPTAILPFLLPAALLAAGGLPAEQAARRAAPAVARAEQLRVYNDVLTQLVEQRWNDRYLGPDEPRIQQARSKAHFHGADTTGLQREINRLRLLLRRHPERQGTVCLLADFRPVLPEWAYFEGEGGLTPFGGTLRAMLQAVAGGATRAALDSLRTGPPQLRASELLLPTARVQPAPAPRSGANYDWYLQGCSIGMVSVSRLVFNAAQTKCLLAYNFYCGGKCGQGELLVVEKRGGHWIIVAAQQCWES
ncbi:hypothetical protein LJ737_23710 [Hymenobacter sp. 15J16-1T3B]|uniref:hypothetical protein n=1 Tax=Hymenobacter sp. 15J16-1T3B TaxID=2886941 RepID=UPI001D11BFAD|nr:hypothetical protein [Hymenobacter sp. 15J16-1T3B]MCC3160264.1 hypothetical protein [Hymenobacter sp. 15J16-1T3B]